MKRFNIAKVVSSKHLTPNMIRIRLRSDMIKSFPNSSEGGHIKLVIPSLGQREKEFERFMKGMSIRKRMRTYTIRHLDQAAGEIDIDFVAHGDDGPASAWALSADIGDFIGFSFPGSPKMKRARSNNYLVAVDMTAFPAAAAGIESLPPDARGDIYVEILSPEDVQPLSAPESMNLHWIVSPPSKADSNDLVEAIRQLPLDGNESVFVAGEYSAVGDLRSYFRKEKGYPKEQLYISSYWKRGLIESEHKRVKTLVA